MLKRFLKLIPPALILAFIVCNFGAWIACANPDWYDSSWLYRKKITINSANVTANLVDFPVLVSLASDSDLASDAQANGDDVAMIKYQKKLNALKQKVLNIRLAETEL